MAKTTSDSPSCFSKNCISTHQTLGEERFATAVSVAVAVAVSVPVSVPVAESVYLYSQDESIELDITLELEIESDETLDKILDESFMVCLSKMKYDELSDEYERLSMKNETTKMKYVFQKMEEL